MKFLKYITAAFLLVVGFTSCEMGEESGTVGTTTVQFANAVVEEGFGAGVVYIPLTISADSEAAMNSCKVAAKVKVVTTGEKYEGNPDTDGLSGDYRITSLDVNFPAYNNYYDEKEPQKYYDEATQKWVKKAQMEIQILNDKVDELCFTLEIESVTEGVTLGENKQCKVVLVKTNRDRLCGNYSGIANIKDYDEEGYYEDSASWTNTVISWDSKYNCFNIKCFAEWQYEKIPFYAYWDDATETMYMLPADPLAYADEAETMFAYTAFYTAWAAEPAGRTLYADERVELVYDIEKGTITFPEDLYFCFAAYKFDSATGSPVGNMAGRFTSAYTGAVLTKK